MKTLTTALFALTLTACGAATSNLADGALAITARSAALEARTEARSWSPAARLRYVEGLGVDGAGRVVQGAGEWRFHYTAAGMAGELLVRVTPLEMVAEERAATSPPGYVLGDNVLGDGWVDSPEALATVLAARATAGTDVTAEMILVPTRPEQWIVRFPEEGSARWTVNAETGALAGGGL